MRCLLCVKLFGKLEEKASGREDMLTVQPPGKTTTKVDMIQGKATTTPVLATERMAPRMAKPMKGESR